jgi:hypothetical protein
LATDSKSQIEHVVQDILLPLIWGKAASVAIVVWLAKEKESRDDIVAQSALDVGSKGDDSIVIHKAAIAM